MLKHNEARSGLGEITVEMLKHGIGVVVQELTCLFNEIWNNKEVPDDWHHSIIFKLPKKGNLINVETGGEITLLSIAGKVFVVVILKRQDTDILTRSSCYETLNGLSNIRGPYTSNS